jgi:hypothetical protein
MSEQIRGKRNCSDISGASVSGRLRAAVEVMFGVDVEESGLPASVTHTN